MTIVPEITSVDGVARHSQIIRLPAPPSLLVDNNCRRAGTKQMGARGEAQGIRWYGGLHGQNSARGKFRTSPRKMRGKFRTKLKYGIFPAEKSPRGIFPPPVHNNTTRRNENFWVDQVTVPQPPPPGNDKGWGTTRAGEGGIKSSPRGACGKKWPIGTRMERQTVPHTQVEDHEIMGQAGEFPAIHLNVAKMALG